MPVLITGDTADFHAPMNLEYQQKTPRHGAFPTRAVSSSPLLALDLALSRKKSVICWQHASICTSVKIALTDILRVHEKKSG